MSPSSLSFVYLNGSSRHINQVICILKERDYPANNLMKMCQVVDITTHWKFAIPL